MHPATAPPLPRRPARPRSGPPARSQRVRAGAPARLPTPLAVLLTAALLALPPLLLGVTAPSAAADERPRGVWPLQPRPVVAARFDPPTSTWGAGHRGVDLVGHPVAVVRTALPGTVRFTGTIAGRGVVVVGHGDTRTTYEPVRATVSVGDAVTAGQPIGLLEVGGSHCFPTACLHWGWLRGETYLDPLLLVGAVPVRLLPPGGLAPAGPVPSSLTSRGLPASPTLLATGAATGAHLASRNRRPPRHSSLSRAPLPVETRLPARRLAPPCPPSRASLPAESRPLPAESRPPARQVPPPCPSIGAPLPGSGTPESPVARRRAQLDASAGATQRGVRRGGGPGGRPCGAARC
ncbi:M23 family metallopeptidase [Nocardioides guangzhouensis]|uniref:M23 family metallopeptidase n=1 Tax=Nocardioides guangzhouensis TaxID=2497878 RepID=UPI001438258C|nr:M23 family metallopeptidase [Nocardioides guangzhouensis]